MLTRLLQASQKGRQGNGNGYNRSGEGFGGRTEQGGPSRLASKVVNDSITLSEVEAFWAGQQRFGTEQSPPTSPGRPDGGAAKKEIAPKMIYGKAGAGDAQLLVAKMQDEVKALQLCQTKVRAKKLPMEVVDAEYQCSPSNSSRRSASTSASSCASCSGLAKSHPTPNAKEQESQDQETRYNPGSKAIVPLRARYAISLNSLDFHLISSHLISSTAIYVLNARPRRGRRCESPPHPPVAPANALWPKMY
ncbi:hypothetical protein C8R47DRAFT_1192479 [Mycena vitilis]|nr:hypothetical protein C8R47DRAFT_1192479 [Mycena vitilis]